MVDINECNNNPRPCEDVCTNTEGSYQCSCSNSSEYITEEGNCTGNVLIAIYKCLVINALNVILQM